MKNAALKLAGTACMVVWIAAMGSLNIPGIIVATLALNAICGAALKNGGHKNGKVHSQK